MDTVALATTGRRTSRLGFGCSSLLGSMTRRESLATLETAFDAGVRHFDVAPSYAFGAAEGCLGEFLKGHSGHATVTTKYGMSAPARQSLIGLVRGLARPLVRLLPGAKQALLQAAALATRPADRPRFLPGPLSASLDRSLMALKTDHIDLYLLHEIEASDLDGPGSDSLLEFLRGAVASGKVGAFGIASGFGKVPALVAGHPAFCAVQQYEWSVLDPVLPEDQAFRLHHRALTKNFREIHAALTQSPATAERWSERVNLDLRQREKLAELMLAAALVMNPKSVIIFSSKNAEHVSRNASLVDELCQSAAMREAAKTFYALIHDEDASFSHPAGSMAEPELALTQGRVTG